MTGKLLTLIICTACDIVVGVKTPAVNPDETQSLAIQTVRQQGRTPEENGVCGNTQRMNNETDEDCL